MNKAGKFRVRRTDDSNPYTWVIADGLTYKNTHNYVDKNGSTTKRCSVYSSKSAAAIALGLYLNAKSNFDFNYSKSETKPTNAIRTFDSGATRDVDQNKLDFEAFNNPLVDKCYATYLNKHRTQSDGGLRDGDNWQKLFGENHFDVCVKSLCRHIVDVRLAHRGYTSEQPIIDSLCAIIFNANAYLFKLMLEEEKADRTKPVAGGY